MALVYIVYNDSLLSLGNEPPSPPVLFRLVGGLFQILFLSLQGNTFVDKSPTLTLKNDAIPFGTPYILVFKQ